MLDIKFGPIREKLEETVVDAQACAPKVPGCLTDCKRTNWVGNASKRVEGCWVRTYYDARWTSCD